MHGFDVVYSGYKCIYIFFLIVQLRTHFSQETMLKIPTQILYQATVLYSEAYHVFMRTDHRPQLELQSAGPSTPSIIIDNQGNVIDSRDGSSEPIQFVFEDIHWTSEISRQEAVRRLDVTFYPFKKVSIH